MATDSGWLGKKNMAYRVKRLHPLRWNSSRGSDIITHEGITRLTIYSIISSLMASCLLLSGKWKGNVWKLEKVNKAFKALSTFCHCHCLLDLLRPQASRVSKAASSFKNGQPRGIISLLPVLSKMLETLDTRWLEDYLDSSKLLHFSNLVLNHDTFWRLPSWKSQNL